MLCGSNLSFLLCSCSDALCWDTVWRLREQLLQHRLLEFRTRQQDRCGLECPARAAITIVAAQHQYSGGEPVTRRAGYLLLPIYRLSFCCYEHQHSWWHSQLPGWWYKPTSVSRQAGWYPGIWLLPGPFCTRFPGWNNVLLWLWLLSESSLDHIISVHTRLPQPLDVSLGKCLQCFSLLAFRHQWTASSAFVFHFQRSAWAAVTDQGSTDAAWWRWRFCSGVAATRCLAVAFSGSGSGTRGFGKSGFERGKCRVIL